MRMSRRMGLRPNGGFTRRSFQYTGAHTFTKQGKNAANKTEY